MKTFPIEHVQKKETLFYPVRPEVFETDILEIGPGNGDFLLSLSKEFSGKKIAAIELREKRFRQIGRRLERNLAKNVTLLWGDARILLPQYFKKESFEKIYILFPDPWPKTRHALWRLLSGDFLQVLQGFLKPEGELLFATDEKPYADAVLKEIRKIAGWKLLPETSKTEIRAKPTYFEQKWMRAGRNICHLQIKKDPLSLGVEHPEGEPARDKKADPVDP
ncbi:MAG: hypothetical protein Q7T03_10955 [Deltaproteobacteria bacterium]|nr:hypothetical protein [Deltaproteobacteria bacterium]